MVAIGTGATVKEAKEDFANSLKEMADEMTEEQRVLLISEPQYQFNITSMSGDSLKD